MTPQGSGRSHLIDVPRRNRSETLAEEKREENRKSRTKQHRVDQDVKKKKKVPRGKIKTIRCHAWVDCLILVGIEILTFLFEALGLVSESGPGARSKPGMTRLVLRTVNPGVLIVRSTNRAVFVRIRKYRPCQRDPQFQGCTAYYRTAYTVEYRHAATVAL